LAVVKNRNRKRRGHFPVVSVVQAIEREIVARRQPDQKRDGVRRRLQSTGRRHANERVRPMKATPLHTVAQNADAFFLKH